MTAREASSGTLYLIPVSFGDSEPAALLPPVTLAALRRLHYFVAENPKSARRFLKAAGHPLPLQEIRIETLNEHTVAGALARLLEPLLQGEDCGMLSEAGCPAIADPGTELVRLAHEHEVHVVPLVGPSAILLALMASGLNGQQFAFHGYLPVETERLRGRLRDLEEAAARTGAAQIFIETPYRNSAMLRTLIETCRADTLLTIATELTLAGESIATRTIAGWKKKPPHLERRPTVFVLGFAGRMPGKT